MKCWNCGKKIVFDFKVLNVMSKNGQNYLKKFILDDTIIMP